MRTFGFIATGFVAAGLLVGIAFGVTSIPDIRRYLKMRAM